MESRETRTETRKGTGLRDVRVGDNERLLSGPTQSTKLEQMHPCRWSVRQNFWFSCWGMEVSQHPCRGNCQGPLWRPSRPDKCSTALQVAPACGVPGTLPHDGDRRDDKPLMYRYIPVIPTTDGRMMNKRRTTDGIPVRETRSSW